MFRTNRWGYDFQFLGGVFEADDIVLGSGWTGQIGGAGFSGELSYFHPIDNFSDSIGQLVASSGINYTFPSSLYLEFDLLYNSTGTTGTIGFDPFLTRQVVTAKTLTLARWSNFGQISYDFNPLTKVQSCSNL